MTEANKHAEPSTGKANEGTTVDLLRQAREAVEGDIPAQPLSDDQGAEKEPEEFDALYHSIVARGGPIYPVLYVQIGDGERQLVDGWHRLLATRFAQHNGHDVEANEKTVQADDVAVLASELNTTSRNQPVGDRRQWAHRFVMEYHLNFQQAARAAGLNVDTVTDVMWRDVEKQEARFAKAVKDGELQAARNDDGTPKGKAKQLLKQWRAMVANMAGNDQPSPPVLVANDSEGRTVNKFAAHIEDTGRYPSGSDFRLRKRGATIGENGYPAHDKHERQRRSRQAKPAQQEPEPQTQSQGNGEQVGHFHVPADTPLAEHERTLAGNAAQALFRLRRDVGEADGKELARLWREGGLADQLDDKPALRRILGNMIAALDELE